MDIYIVIILILAGMSAGLCFLLYREALKGIRLKAMLEAEIMRPLKLEDCYLERSGNGKLGKYVISGYALIDIERFQEIIMEREEYELAEFLQPIVDSAKIKGL